MKIYESTGINSPPKFHEYQWKIQATSWKLKESRTKKVGKIGRITE